MNITVCDGPGAWYMRNLTKKHENLIRADYSVSRLPRNNLVPSLPTVHLCRECFKAVLNSWLEGSIQKNYEYMFSTINDS